MAVSSHTQLQHTMIWRTDATRVRYKSVQGFRDGPGEKANEDPARVGQMSEQVNTAHDEHTHDSVN